MSRAVLVVRVFLGLLFFVFGLNGFFHFMPAPPPPEGPAGAYMVGLAATGYFIPLLKTVETVSGALLLVGAWVPLALVLLAPIVVHIALFNVLLAPTPESLVIAAFVVLAELFLAWAYRGAWTRVLERSAQPSV